MKYSPEMYVIVVLLVIVGYLYAKSSPHEQQPITNNIAESSENTTTIVKQIPKNIIYSDSYESDNPLYVVNRNLNRLINPLLPPERSNPSTGQYDVDISPISTPYGVPINIPTRGAQPNYSQVGILTHNGADNIILPLFGKPVYSGSRKWLYYTTTDKNNMIKIPISHKNRDCSGDFGCDELNDSEELTIPAYNNKNFQVTIYHLDKPRYIPYV